MEWRNNKKIGSEILTYLKKYEGTENYKTLAEAIQFGYSLCEIEYIYEEFQEPVPVLNNIDWSKITDNDLVIQLIKERERISNMVFEIDELALVNFELQKLDVQ